MKIEVVVFFPKPIIESPLIHLQNSLCNDHILVFPQFWSSFIYIYPNYSLPWIHQYQFGKHRRSSLRGKKIESRPKHLIYFKKIEHLHMLAHFSLPPSPLHFFHWLQWLIIRISQHLVCPSTCLIDYNLKKLTNDKHFWAQLNNCGKKVKYKITQNRWIRTCVFLKISGCILKLGVTDILVPNYVPSHYQFFSYSSFSQNYRYIDNIVCR